MSNKIVTLFKQLICNHKQKGEHLVKMFNNKVGFNKYQCTGCNKIIYIKN